MLNCREWRLNPAVSCGECYGVFSASSGLSVLGEHEQGARSGVRFLATGVHWDRRLSYPPELAGRGDPGRGRELAVSASARPGPGAQRLVRAKGEARFRRTLRTHRAVPGRRMAEGRGEDFSKPGELILGVARQDSNLRSPACEAGVLPLDDGTVRRVAGAGVEPADTSLSDWRLCQFAYPARSRCGSGSRTQNAEFMRLGRAPAHPHLMNKRVSRRGEIRTPTPNQGTSF